MDPGSGRKLLVPHTHIELSTPAREAAFVTKTMPSHALSLFFMNIHQFRLIPMLLSSFTTSLVHLSCAFI